MIYMASNLVARAKNPEIKSSQEDLVLSDRDEVRLAAARALAQGFSSRQVAKAMVNRLTTNNNETQAYQKLRRWATKDQAFRDLIYHEAVVSLDLKTPLILGGIAKAAIRGRVDAAKLALEVTGRHTSHEAPITNVAVVLNNIPRPEG